VIRLAKLGDIPAILRLRDAYYASHREPVQQRDHVTWWVAEENGSIIAVQSYDRVNARECYVMDSYTDGTPAGAAGLAELSQRIAEEADAQGFYLLGFMHLDDRKMIRHSMHRGWQPSAVLMSRAPKTTSEVA
jgi:N-acetylglutamate synthase-like GNAT family acetyltransferase